MPDALKLGFGAFTAPAKGVLIVFCDDKLKFGPATTKAIGPAGPRRSPAPPRPPASPARRTPRSS